MGSILLNGRVCRGVGKEEVEFQLRLNEGVNGQINPPIRIQL